MPVNSKDRPIAEMVGIGPVTAQRLREVDITTEAALRELGAAAAYRRLRLLGAGVTRNALWGLHAALTGERWTEMDAATKARLLREAGES